MQKINSNLNYVVFTMAVTLTACNQLPEQPAIANDHVSQIKQLKEQTQSNWQGTVFTQTVQKPKPIEVLRQAPWLSDKVIASYGGVKAKTAIKTILQQRPVRFEISGTNNPPVQVVPNANTFAEHLDGISVQTNWAYTINDGVVVFTDWIVKNYQLDFVIGNKSSSLNVPGIDGQSGGGTNSFSVGSDSGAEVGQILDNIFANAVSPNEQEDLGGRQPSYTVIKATNSVLVSAPPNIHQQVKAAITDINAVAGRSIYLNFDIYAVDLQNKHQRAVDIQALSNYGVQLVSKQAAGSMLGEASPLLFGLKFDTGNANDQRQIMLQALSSQGEATLTNEGSLLLKNNEVGSIQNTRLDRFVEVGLGADNVTTAPAYHESLIQVLPSIMGEQINLRLIFSATDVEPYLAQLTSKLVDGIKNTQIQMDKVRLGERFDIPTEINNGETLMLAGLSTQTAKVDSNSNPLLPALGKGLDHHQARREVIIVMTAYVMD